jgi:riboflavin synthase
MFTGIVESAGEILKVEDVPRGRALWIRSRSLSDSEVGASVAISGVCLTVTDRDGDVCRFDVAAETLVRTTLGALEPGAAVNLERPVRAGDELGGHLVQGHVDGVGIVVSVEPEGRGARVRVTVDRGLLRYVVEKGSVTLDGVSLTVTTVTPSSFEVALVPHTLEVTTLGGVRAQHRVNVEVDVLAKYVEKLVTRTVEAP